MGDGMIATGALMLLAQDVILVTEEEMATETLMLLARVAMLMGNGRSHAACSKWDADG